MLYGRWVRLVMASAITASMWGLWAGPAEGATAPTDWQIKKDDKVVTILDTPLREETQVLATILAGTELTVLDANGDFVSVSTTSGGETKTGWVYARHLRTPAMLKKLSGLHDDFKDYQLWSKPLPTLPESLAFRRVGRPAPLGDLAVSKTGVASLQTLSDASEEKKDRAASSLERLVRQYMLDRGWPRTFDADSSWQIVVACESVRVASDDGRMRGVLAGHVFLVNTHSRRLLLHTAISGEGVSEEEMQREFAKQAADEYAEILMRWGTAPARTSGSTQTTTPPPKPEPKRPPFGPPGAPPFGQRPF